MIDLDSIDAEFDGLSEGDRKYLADEIGITLFRPSLEHRLGGVPTIVVSLNEADGDGDYIAATRVDLGDALFEHCDYPSPIHAMLGQALFETYEAWRRNVNDNGLIVDSATGIPCVIPPPQKRD